MRTHGTCDSTFPESDPRRVATADGGHVAGGRFQAPTTSLLVWVLIAIGLHLLATAGWSPQSSVPSRDSGVFLYVGSGLLEGEVPYRDRWDHKGPLVYLIAATAAVLPLPPQTAITLLRLVASVVVMALIGRALGRLMPIWTAVPIVGVATLLQAILGEGGNMTEEHAMLASLIALAWVIGAAAKLGQASWAPLIAAGLTVFALGLRPNLVGFPASLGITIIMAQWRHRHRFPLAPTAAAGALTIVLSAVVYLAFYEVGAGRNLVDAYLVYNTLYVPESPFVGILATASAVAHSPLLGLVVMTAAATWIPVAVGLVSPGFERLRPLLVLLLPLELLFLSLSGCAYLHYFLTLIVPMVVQLANLAAVIGAPRRSSLAGSPMFRRILAACVPMLVFAALTHVAPAPETSDLDRLRSEAGRFLELHTRPEDRVLMWGAETSVNVIAGRRSSSPYFYAYPLLMPGFEARLDLEAWYRDLEQHAPALVIDTSSTNPVVPPLEAEARATWIAAGGEMTAVAAEFIAWCDTHYESFGVIGGRTCRWLLLHPRPDRDSGERVESADSPMTPGQSVR